MGVVPPLVDGALTSNTFARLATAPMEAGGTSTGVLVSWVERKEPRGRGVGGGCAVVGSDLVPAFVELGAVDDPLGPADLFGCTIEIVHNILSE